MKTIVFKQSYKSANEKKSRMLNIKHLHYIATRPGIVRNNGCGFGLFGKLTYMPEQRNIDSLWHAQKMLGEASKRHTMYRAIISLDHESALEKGYYKRSSWEELIKNNVSLVSTEMGIEHRDMCYMAAMHYKKGHPHVHMIYWDNSNKVRSDFIQKDKFVIAMEKIRAGFGKVVFAEELSTAFAEKSDSVATARDEMLALMKELNNEEILDVNKIKPTDIELIRSNLSELLRHLQPEKSKRYAYLSSNGKQSVDDFSERLFSAQPQFRRLHREYLKVAKAISSYYGNDKDSQAHHVKNADEAFKKDVGNVVLKFIKENGLSENFELSHLPQREQISEQLHKAIQRTTYNLDIFKEMQAAFPVHRTPLKEIANDDFNARLHKLTRSLLLDSDVSIALSTFINGSIADCTSNGGFELFCTDSDKPSEAALESRQQLKEYSKELYTGIYGEARAALLSKLYDESGYREDYECEQVLLLAMSVFSEVGRSKNHLESKERHRQGKSLSKEARRDMRERLKHSQDYEL